MTTRHLHQVEAAEPTRVNSREEIAAWDAERRAVLTALFAREQHQLDLADERQAA